MIGGTPSRGATAGAREALLRGLRVAGAAPISETYGIGTAFSHLSDDGYDDEAQAAVRAVIESLLATLRS